FVRGVPYELSAGNHRPTRMMERFWEAHDLILKAWTSHDGPFNWEGKYFHHRQVNIWPRPYQQPHPPVWITALSPASARDVGEKGYVVACFLTGFQGTKTIFESYHTRRAELGLPAPGLDRFAYAALVYTGETDEEGYAGARKLMWYVESNKVPPQFTNPPGYQPIAATVSAMKGSAGIFKDRKSTRLNSSHVSISYAVFCLKKKIHPYTAETLKSHYTPQIIWRFQPPLLRAISLPIDPRLRIAHRRATSLAARFDLRHLTLP